jgi:hypothetical protein
VLSQGTYIQIIIEIIKQVNQGIILLDNVINSTPLILLTKNKLGPNGGVINPVIILNTNTTPKCIKSIPSADITGKNIGVNNSMIASPSKKHPRKITNTLTNNNIVVGSLLICSSDSLSN